MSLRSWWKRIWRRRTKPPARKEASAPPPRSAAGLGGFAEALFARLGARYQPGSATADGIRIQCRHARQVFRDIECYVDGERRRVSVRYDVRLSGGRGAPEALALVRELYGAELDAAGMQFEGARDDGARTGVVRLEFAREDADAGELARFIDFYARASEAFLDMRHLEEARPET